ncbi:MAG: hypothetical protein ABIP53_02355 [Candidatus Limnocylindrales bacterium]
MVVAIWRVRAPLARATELDRLADNAKRYDSWRGGRSSGRADETTGADVTRAMLRREILTWAGVGAAGVLLLIVGFAVR